MGGRVSGKDRSCTAAQLRGAARESWEILSQLQVWF
jgi:hypothetical protein